MLNSVYQAKRQIFVLSWGCLAFLVVGSGLLEVRQLLLACLLSVHGRTTAIRACKTFVVPSVPQPLTFFFFFFLRFWILLKGRYRQEGVLGNTFKRENIPDPPRPPLLKRPGNKAWQLSARKQNQKQKKNPWSSSGQRPQRQKLCCQTLPISSFCALLRAPNYTRGLPAPASFLLQLNTRPERRGPRVRWTTMPFAKATQNTAAKTALLRFHSFRAIAPARREGLLVWFHNLITL